MAAATSAALRWCKHALDFILQTSPGHLHRKNTSVLQHQPMLYLHKFIATKPSLHSLLLQGGLRHGHGSMQWDDGRVCVAAHRLNP